MIKKGFGVSISSPIKILHVISSLEMGGAEQWLVDMVYALQARGFVQKVLYFHPGPHVKSLQDHGITCIQIEGRYVRYDPFFWKQFYTLVRDFKPMVVHSSLWAANFMSRLVGWWYSIPVINTYHSAIDHASFVRRMGDKLTARLAHVVVSVSSEVEKKITAAARLQSDQCQVIKNGMDLKLFDMNVKRFALDRSDLDIPKDAFVIGTVGRFVAVKNLFFLLDVVAEFSKTHKNIYALIIGTGPLESQLRAHAELLSIQDNVRFVIAQPAYKYYSLMNCYMQTSLHEGFGLAVLEAMYSRIPVIVSSPDGTHPFVQDGVSGLIVKGWEKTDYLYCLDLVLQHANLGVHLAENARQLVCKSYHVGAMVDSYEKIYNQVCSISDSDRNNK